MVSVRGFPIAPEELTAEWLTSALRAGGAIAHARVESFGSERIGEGAGFVGQLARITPTYDRREPSAPGALIAKFPSADPMTRQFVASYGLYRCEVNFYRHIAGSVSLRTARCFASEMNDDDSEFVLLLEDLASSGRIGDQVEGCGLEDARLALTELARFHASWWQRPELDALVWLPLAVDLGRTSLEQQYPLGWQASLDRYAHTMSPALRDAAPTLNQRVLATFDRFEEAPLTIMHGDFRLDNMFFGRPGSGYALAVLDWQISNRGWGMYDVGYFLSSNLPTERRRAHEASLVRAYHDALVEHGVSGYSWERCWDDYVTTMILYLANLIGNVPSLDTTNERGARLFDLMFERVAAAAVDLDSLASLD